MHIESESQRLAFLTRSISIALLLGALATAPAGSAWAADGDSDGVLDEVDNCVSTPNPSQANDDFDRLGNACDGDLDQDGDVDGDDRGLVEDEVAIQAGLDPTPPRRAADFNDDGAVDSLDQDYFDDRLITGLEPRVAGADAHDADGDGILDFCAATAPGTFTGQWDPVTHPNLLLELDEDEEATHLVTPDGTARVTPDLWEGFVGPSVMFQDNVRKVGGGAWEWTQFAKTGSSSSIVCTDKACIQPKPIPVTYGKTYAYSHYSCAPTFPPTTTWLIIREYDVNGDLVGNGGRVLNGSISMNSSRGVWEEVAYYYTPTSPDVETVRVRLGQKTGPTVGKGVVFLDDFAFYELDAGATPTYRSPPATKRAFDGTRTKIDEHGNAQIFRDGQWQSFIPMGIYVASGASIDLGEYQSRYSDAGFNLAMNETGKSQALIAKTAVDATSTFNPDGMEFMFISHRHHDENWGLSTLEDRLAEIDSGAISPGGEEIADRLFAYNYDNEIYNNCPTNDAGGSCITSATMWEAQAAPLARIFEFDRALNDPPNDHLRSVPSYFLNGNPGNARAYTLDDEAKVGASGDYRMDITGSYGPAAFAHLERIENQVAPGFLVQVQTNLFDKYRPYAWGGIAVGARAIGTWRDWDCDSSTTSPCGAPYMGTRLTICGSTDFQLATRDYYFPVGGPSGAIIEGESSNARAELLSKDTNATDCGTGVDARRYIVQPILGNFEAGETLRIYGGNQIEQGGTVASVKEQPVFQRVDYTVGITERSWWSDLPQLRSEIDALSDVIEHEHDTFVVDCIATDSQGARVPFGNEGIVCGSRGTSDKYIIIANTASDLDPYAAWGQQLVGKTLDLTIKLPDIGQSPSELRPFDPVTLQFTATGAIPWNVTGYHIQGLAPFETRVYKAHIGNSGCGLVGLELLLVVGAAQGLRRRILRRDSSTG